MDAEEYLREDIKCFNDVYDALAYIDIETQLNVLDLKPLKGQKIFNPSFD